MLAAASASACPSSGRPTVRDPERASESEYDVARDLFLRRNEPRQALDHALEAVELDSENADAAHLVGLIYLSFCQKGPEECRLDEAEKHVRRAIEIRKDYREAVNTLGVILVHEHRYADAIGVLEPLTRDILYVTPEIAWGNLGWAYLEKGDPARAIDALNRSVAAEPRFCVGHFRLGLAYEKKKDYAAALESLDTALEAADAQCKGMQEAWASRARVLVSAGRGADAKKDLETCTRLSSASRIGKECRSMLDQLK